MIQRRRILERKQFLIKLPSLTGDRVGCTQRSSHEVSGKLIFHDEDWKAAHLIRWINVCYPVILVLIYLQLSGFIFWATY